MLNQHFLGSHGIHIPALAAAGLLAVSCRLRRMDTWKYPHMPKGAWQAKQCDRSVETQ